MAEVDALGSFDFSKVTGGGLFLKWEAGKPITMRVLTTNPVVSSETFEDKATGEVNITTKFNFVIYNWTDSKAQILSATPAMAKKITELHLDTELTGGDIKTVDIRISPTGEKLNRRYDVQVLPKAKDLTNDIINECKEINLDEKVQGDRLSVYEPAKYQPSEETKKAIAEEYGANESLGGEIDLNDIPF